MSAEAVVMMGLSWAAIFALTAFCLTRLVTRR